MRYLSNLPGFYGVHFSPLFSPFVRPVEGSISGAQRPLKGACHSYIQVSPIFLVLLSSVVVGKFKNSPRRQRPKTSYRLTRLTLRLGFLSQTLSFPPLSLSQMKALFGRFTDNRPDFLHKDLLSYSASALYFRAFLARSLPRFQYGDNWLTVLSIRTNQYLALFVGLPV